jgi:hypothetical protein
MLMIVLMGYEFTQKAGNLLAASCWYCDLAGAVEWASNMYLKIFHIGSKRFRCYMRPEVLAFKRL